MSINLRIALVIMAVITFTYIMRRIRKSQMRIEDSLYWIFVAVALLIAALFPQIPIWLSDLLHIQSPANFVYLSIIFMLLIHDFMLTLQVSKLENKTKDLAQRYAIDNAKIFSDNKHQG
jgi:hypothetical protein